MNMAKAKDTWLDSGQAEGCEAVEKMFRGVDRVETLAARLIEQPGEFGEHVRRVRQITQYLLAHTPAGETLTPDVAAQVDLGVILHDVGKLLIPASILEKSGKLTREEYEIMKAHTIRGAELLRRIPQFENQAAFACVYDIVRHHHERWDGRGYPDGLRGGEISLWVQVMSMADVYDALVIKRVYKDAFAYDKVVQMMLNGECGAFRPEMLRYFLGVEPELRAFYAGRADERAAHEK